MQRWVAKDNGSLYDLTEVSDMKIHKNQSPKYCLRQIFFFLAIKDLNLFKKPVHDMNPHK